jgi:hypothetical protein
VYGILKTVSNIEFFFFFGGVGTSGSVGQA